MLLIFNYLSLFLCSFQAEKTDTIPLIYMKDTISTDQYEFGGTFTPDGNEFYFTKRTDYQSSENRIFVSKKINGTWQKPEMATFASDVFEFLPYISPEGKNIYFYSEREKPIGSRSLGNLWYCHKTDTGWSEAKFFDESPNIEYCMSITSTLDDKLYFSGKYQNKFGVYCSKFENGRYSSPKILPENINFLRPAHPYIAPDESYLLFDAQPGGMGKSQIFITFNNYDGTWTNPEKLPECINLTSTEFAPSVSPDGKYLFFHRRVDNNGDIYFVSTDLLKRK